jgi:hypothetical protein
MSKYITNEISAATLQEVKDLLNKAALLCKPFSVSVLSSDKIGVRIMAEGREGQVRLVERIARQHEGSLSRSDNPMELTGKLQLDGELESVRQIVMMISEMINDTQWGNSADIMQLSDRYAASLQSQRGHETALDNALSELDDYNKRYAGRSAKQVVVA